MDIVKVLFTYLFASIRKLAVAFNLNSGKQTPPDKDISVEMRDRLSEERYQLTENAPRMFMQWLRLGLQQKALPVNRRDAVVHIVDEGIFLLAPAIFKLFLREHNLNEDLHKYLSRRFSRLRIHTRNGELNMHSYWVVNGDRAAKLNGWVLPYSAVYEYIDTIPKSNRYLRQIKDFR